MRSLHSFHLKQLNAESFRVGITYFKVSASKAKTIDLGAHVRPFAYSGQAQFVIVESEQMCQHWNDNQGQIM